MHQIDVTRRVHQSLFQLGHVEQFDSVAEIPKVCAWLEEQAQEFPAAVLSAFRIMATEQPHKTALTAALIAHLVLAPSAQSLNDPDNKTLGMRVLDLSLIHI